MTYEEFANVIKEHEKWLAGKGGKRAEIIDQKIENGGDEIFNLSVNIKNVNLSKAILKNVEVSGLNMENVNLEGADISGLFTCIHGEWKNVNLEGANLEGCNITMYTFDNVNFSNANMKNARFMVCEFVNSNLEGANLEGANLEGSVFNGTDSSGLNPEKENVKDTISRKRSSKTRFDIEMDVNQIADEVSSDYDVPKDFYGDCYCDEIMHLENKMEMMKYEEEIEECMDEVREILISYAESYKENE